MKQRVVAQAFIFVIVGLAGCADQAPEQLASMDLTSMTGIVDAPCLALCSFEFKLATQPWTEILVSWDGTRSTGFDAHVTGPGQSNWTLQRGFDAARIVLADAQPGDYRLLVEGTGDVFIRIQALNPASGEAMLPNIVTMIPAQIAFGNCHSVERDEQGAKRCLRLGNGVGNAGRGPLEVAMSHADGAFTIASEVVDVATGRFVQHIYNADGSYEQRPVGPADFHLSHRHFHYDGFARFELFPVTDGLRGEVAAAGQKSGFCFLDWGRMQEPEVEGGSGQSADQACSLPNEKGWSMGVSAGWFDFYWADLADQYIEASGVADGLYELVSTADPDDHLLELDEADNAASVLIRILDGEVEVLEERGFYRLPSDTANL